MADMQSFYAFIITAFLLFIVFVMAAWYKLYWARKYHVSKRKDLQVFLLKNGGFDIQNKPTENKNFIRYNTVEYPVTPSGCIRNKFGRTLTVYSEGKPAPLHLEYNGAKWLDSTNLKILTQNEVIKNFYEGKNKLKELLLIVTCVVSIITLIVLTFVAMRIFNVLKPSGG
jgi:hypothetical protein